MHRLRLLGGGSPGGTVPCLAQGRVVVGKETQNSISVQALIPEDIEVLSVRGSKQRRVAIPGLL